MNGKTITLIQATRLEDGSLQYEKPGVICNVCMKSCTIVRQTAFGTVCVDCIKRELSR